MNLSDKDKQKIFQADLSNIVRKVKAGKPLTATERKLIEAQQGKPEEGEKLYSVNSLSKLTGRDRRTIDKAVAGIAPAKMVGGRAVYRLADVQAALAKKPDKGLKESKLGEEIRKLKLANDERAGKLIAKALVRETLARSFSEIARLLDTKLECEYPALVVGLDIAGARVKGKQLNDAIRVELHKLMEAWPE